MTVASLVAKYSRANRTRGLYRPTINRRSGESGGVRHQFSMTMGSVHTALFGMIFVGNFLAMVPYNVWGVPVLAEDAKSTQ